MTLSAAQIERLSQWADQALALPDAAREAWLQGLDRDDAPLAARLRGALAQSVTGALGSLPALDDGPVWVGHAGERVGPYELVAPLGRGGMGEVWRARRADGAFEREVALKIPRRRVGQDLAARLQFECKVAARLEHRHIARLYDAGLDEQARPWVASEWVQGRPLDEAAQGQPLATRLRWLAWLARAVAHAHGRGVLHRDLKPANVLVDGDGVPRLLDFGVAALTDQADGDDAPRALTPRYAAPEQQRGEAEDVRTDVFALGVMAAELCPQAASDLAAVIAKAQAPDPDHRYAGAAELAEELERCQRGEPVAARPLGWLARRARWLERNPLAGSAAGAVLVAMLVGGGVSLVQSQRAEQAIERERTVRTFASDLFRFQAPTQFLEQGAGLIEQRFAHDPGLQAQLYAAVGQAYSEMGVHRLALLHRERQLAALQAAASPRPERDRAQQDLAEVHLNLGEPEAALRVLDQRAGEDSAWTEALRARALVDLGHFDAAGAALVRLHARLPSQAPNLARAWWRAIQAEIDLRNGRLDTGFDGLDAAAAEARAVEGRDSLQAVDIVLRGVYHAALAERRSRVEGWVAEASRVLRAKGGPHAVRAILEEARMWRSLGNTLRSVSRDEALQGLQKALDELRALGPAVPALALAEVEGRLGEMQFDFGDLAGEALIEQHHELRRAALRRPMDAVALHGVAAAAAAEVGRYEVALARSRDRHAARVAAGRARHPNVAVDLRQQALIHAMAGQTESALAVLDRAPAAATVVLATGLEPPWYENVLREARARVLLDAGRSNEALALLPQRAPHPQDFVLVGLSTAPPVVRGEALCRSGRAREGWPLLRDHLARLNPNHHPFALPVARLRAVAAACAAQAGDAAAGRGLAEQARAAFAAQPRAAAYYARALQGLRR